MVWKIINKCVTGKEFSMLGHLEGVDHELEESLMDIDQQQLIGNATTTFSAQPPSGGVRRAPVMGNRGLESQHRGQRDQDRSRTKSKTIPPKEGKGSSRGSPRSSRRSADKTGVASSGTVQVAALDERNLKKAVHRYGTLPKGARIGAYLESLRQSGMTPEPVTEQGVDSDATIDSGSLGGGDTLEKLQGGRSSQNSGSINMGGMASGHKQQQQQPMLRSNSSHGGFVSNNNAPRGRASPRTNPGQITRLGQPGSFDHDAAGPSRGATIALNDLEFPPPPVDLPPPPQSFQTFQQTSSFKPNISPNNTTCSPRSQRRDFSLDNRENGQNLPELLARSTLEKRKELSSDSCDSIDRSYHNSMAMPENSCQFNQQHTPKSPVSPPLSECRTLGSPAVGSLSSPGSTLDEGGRMVLLRDSSSNRINSPAEPIRPFNSFTATNNNSSTPSGAHQKASMEMKLLNEIRDNSASSLPACSPIHPDTHIKTLAPMKSPGSSPTHNGNSNNGNPAAMLVTELFETIKAKSTNTTNNRIPTPEKMMESSSSVDDKHHEVDFKANLRKVRRPDEREDSERKNIPTTPKHIDFKSQLKKTESTYANPEVLKPDVRTSNSKSMSESLESGSNKQFTSGERLSRTQASNDDKQNTNPIIDFKSKLRKSTSKQEQTSTTNDDIDDAPPLNFQARLRKTSGTSKAPNASNDNNTSLSDVKKNQNGAEKRDSVDSIGSGGAGIEQGDDKRKSTGSITSLRKMWESGKDSNAKDSNPASKSPITDEPTQTNSSASHQKRDTQDHNSSSLSHSTVKFEKRVWPPVPNTETEKPMVPVKPTVKPTPAPPTTKPPPPKEPAPSSLRTIGKITPPKPPMAAKPNVCNIYAAPTTITSRRTGKLPSSSDHVDTRPPPYSAQPTHSSTATAANTTSHETHSGGSGCSSSSTSEREGIEGGVNRGALLVNCHNLSDTLDSTSSKLIMEEKLSKTNIMQLSEQVSDVHTAALIYVDNIPATGRFRYRSLCNKLEEQSKELRELSIGNNKIGGSSINASSGGYNDVVNDIQTTVKGLVNVIQR